MTLSHLVSVVNMVEENTKVEEASSFCCDSVSPTSAKEHNCVCKFANTIERD